MKLKTVISGGQTGADQGGLEAANEFGLETGGWIGKGFLTENGSEPGLEELFGLQALHVTGGGRGYAVRTHMNVIACDATIRFASDWGSRGECCTLKAIKRYDKDYMDVDVDIDDPTGETHPSLNAVCDWLEDGEYKTLNVAGNRESKCPGLQRFVATFLLEVFKELKRRSVRKLNQAAELLNQKLERFNWLAAVAVGGVDGDQLIHVYTNGRPPTKDITLIRQGWMGYPILIERIGKVRPASA